MITNTKVIKLITLAARRTSDFKNTDGFDVQVYKAFLLSSRSFVNEMSHTDFEESGDSRVFYNVYDCCFINSQVAVDTESTKLIKPKYRKNLFSPKSELQKMIDPLIDYLIDRLSTTTKSSKNVCYSNISPCPESNQYSESKDTLALGELILAIGICCIIVSILYIRYYSMSVMHNWTSPYEDKNSYINTLSRELTLNAVHYIDTRLKSYKNAFPKSCCLIEDTDVITRPGYYKKFGNTLKSLIKITKKLDK